jgi:3-oxoacyl-[acyl-carrier protein] reductase
LGDAHAQGPQHRPLAAPTISGFDDLRGKAVLVTGASTGIGAAVAQAFGGCGAKVAVHYNRSAADADGVAQAVRAAGGTAVTLRADLADPRNAGKLVADAAAALGGLDVLINNAGHVLGRTPIAETSDERFHAIMDLNFTSLFIACRAAIPLMRAGGGGAIVNTSSVAARIGGGPGAAIYGAAKAAVSNFSRGLAKELVGDRIRVNVVAPGVIETPLHVALTPPDAWVRFINVVPMARAGTAEECAGAYLYLASERLSSYVTGQVIEVNGGQLMP